MNPDVLQFQCSACKSVLTVPSQMAGVTGPCPVCGQTVTSPNATPPPSPSPGSLFSPRPSAPPAPSPAPVSPGLPLPGMNPVMPNSIAQHLSPMGGLPPTSPMPGMPPASQPPRGGFLDDLIPTPSSQPQFPPSPSPGLGQALLGGLPPNPQAAAPAPVPNPAFPPVHSGLPPRRPEGVPPQFGNPSQSATPWGAGGSATGGIPPFPTQDATAGNSPASPLFPQRATGGGAPLHSSLIPGSPTLPTMGNQGGPDAASNSLLSRDIPSAPSAQQASPPIQLPERKDLATAPAAAAPRTLIRRPKRSSNIFMVSLAVLLLGGFLAIAGWRFREPIMALVSRYMPGSKEIKVELPLPDPNYKEETPELAATPVPEASAPQSPDPDPTAAPPSPPKMAFDPDQVKPPRAEPATPEDLAALQAPGPKPTSPTAIPGDNPGLTETPPKAMSSALQNGNAQEVTSVSPNPTTRELKIEVTEEAKPAADALMRFLTAKTLEERLQYTLAADMMKPIMERYYQGQPSGPVRIDAVGLVRMDPKPQVGGGAHAVFGVESRDWEYPVPVMLEETAKGFQVDWLSFVEFKDRILEKFFEGYQEGPARFHVGITRTHYFEDKVPNTDNKDAFRIGPAPPNPYLNTVFLEKDSQLGRELKDRIPWGAQVWAIVDLEWVKLGNQQWVQLAGVPQLNWYSVPNEKKNKSGKSTDLPNEVQRAVPVGR